MRKDKGFSVIEMVAALVIVLVSLFIALPTFQNWLHNKHEQAVVTMLQDSIILAKARALADAKPVTICAGIKDECANWQQGYRLLSKDGTLIKQYSLPKDIVLSYQGFPNASALLFNEDGTTSNGTFTINSHIKLVINRRGRARLE